MSYALYVFCNGKVPQMGQSGYFLLQIFLKARAKFEKYVLHGVLRSFRQTYIVGFVTYQ